MARTRTVWRNNFRPLPTSCLCARAAAFPESTSQRLEPCCFVLYGGAIVGATRTRHRFHAICPYFAMFPEAFAERWINQLTRPGDLILDPFSGRGTTVFQANLMGRRGLACDINPVAFVLSKA